MLEQRTGAKLTIKLVYEGCGFTKENYQEVSSTLQKKRRRRNVVSRVSVEHIVQEDGTKVCRIFNRPHSTYISIPNTKNNNNPKNIHKNKKDYETPSDTDISDNSNRSESEVGAASQVRMPVDHDLVQPNSVTHGMGFHMVDAVIHTESQSVPTPEPDCYHHLQNTADLKAPSLPGMLGNELRSPSPVLAQDSTDTDPGSDTYCKNCDRNGTEMYLAPSSTSTVGLSSEIHVGTPGRLKDNSSPSKAHLVSATVTGRITDPVCAMCQRLSPLNVQGRRNDFIPWIRCSDALCQYLVHASCIGFLVSSRHELKRLPPYYCQAHRDDMYLD